MRERWLAKKAEREHCSWHKKRTWAYVTGDLVIKPLNKRMKSPLPSNIQKYLDKFED
jgi:hypothetical protein